MTRKILTALMAVGMMASGLSANMIRIDTKEVVYDTDTKLMWQDNSDTNSIRRQWQDATDYCKNLTFAGYNDWELPDKDTLNALRRKQSSLNNVVLHDYWTSTTHESDTSYAWFVDFDYVNDFWGRKTDSYYVRCVHSGQSFEPVIIKAEEKERIQAEKERIRVKKENDAYNARIAKFRKNLQEGDETSNGLVVQVKGNLVKIQTNDSQCSQRDYKGNCSNWINTPVEKWVKRSEIYPK